MTYEMYRMIYIIAAVCAVVFLVIAAILFAVLKIPKVIGELSGLTAKKAIGQIQQRNESDHVSGVLESKNKSAKDIQKRGTTSQMAGLRMATEKIGTKSLQRAAEETTLLQQASEETTLLNQNTMEKTVLHQAANETTVLSQNMSQAQENGIFEIVQEITFIHTNEIVM